MCIIKFSTQQHNGIYDTTNNLKIIISVRGGNLLFLQCLLTNTCTCTNATTFSIENRLFRNEKIWQGFRI